MQSRKFSINYALLRWIITIVIWNKVPVYISKKKDKQRADEIKRNAYTIT